MTGASFINLKIFQSGMSGGGHQPAIEPVEELITPVLRQLRIDNGDKNIMPMFDIPIASCHDESGTEDNGTDERDPYALKAREYRRVSYEEYNQSLIEPIHHSVSVKPHEFFDTAQHLLGKRPPNIDATSYDTHDPMLLVRAAALASNIKLCARQTASYVPYVGLQTLENYDTTKVLKYLQSNPQAKERIDASVEQFIYSVMIVDLATREAQTPDIVSNVLSSSSSSTKSRSI
jgi:hypothetical protein